MTARFIGIPPFAFDHILRNSEVRYKEFSECEKTWKNQGGNAIVFWKRGQRTGKVFSGLKKILNEKADSKDSLYCMKKEYICMAGNHFLSSHSIEKTPA
jgi:hypothetical protein